MEIELKIDPEFQGKIPPLTDAEFNQLKENILAAGEVYEPIAVWNGTIVDGHNRYKIVQEYPEIKWRTRELQFADKWEAFDWMYKNQLGRRNLTDEQKTYLLGKLYEARKHTSAFKGNQYVDECGRRQNDAKQPGRVREQIMAEQGVGQKTVERSEYYAHGIDAIRETDAKLADSILKAEKKIPKIDIQEIGTADPEKRMKMIETVKAGKRIERLEPVRKREPYNTKQDRIDREELKDIINGLCDDTLVEYTIENLVDQIKSNADAFIRSISNLIMDHKDICNENMHVVIKAIDESITVRVIQMKERMENGTQL